MNIITTKIQIPASCKEAFADWQAKFHAVIANFPGFISLEILLSDDEWMITQRFSTDEMATAWSHSKERQELMSALKEMSDQIKESNAPFEGVVTEVFVTEISPGKERAFREWIAKIHEVEAKFPGFRGLYIQSPTHGKNWISLLQFDTPENLDRWLTSLERKALLKQLNPLIASIESHRVISPYAGWFASIASNEASPAVWKQTMLVLLVLFPIVMLEMRFLFPHTFGLGTSLATFIGNALSVSLIAWVMMPLALKGLGWWFSPGKSLLGAFVVAALYLIEILIFW